MAEQANQKPVVIVDNAKVTYRVYASGKAVNENSNDSRVKRQGNLRTVEAIKGVSLVAYEGDVIGVIGTNGSGKTSLMKAISGLSILRLKELFSVALTVRTILSLPMKVRFMWLLPLTTLRRLETTA